MSLLKRIQECLLALWDFIGSLLAGLLEALVSEEMGKIIILGLLLAVGAGIAWSLFNFLWYLLTGQWIVQPPIQL